MQELGSLSSKFGTAFTDRLLQKELHIVSFGAATIDRSEAVSEVHPKERGHAGNKATLIDLVHGLFPGSDIVGSSGQIKCCRANAWLRVVLGPTVGALP